VGAAVSAVGDVVMPRLSDSMEEGTILRWLKQPGDEVAVGDELVEIETDKATMTYAADVAGTLLELLARDGETVAIGAQIARIGDPAAVASAPARAARIAASPVARRMARDRGVELSGIVGSGPGGRIVKADVEAAIPATSPNGGSASIAERERPAPLVEAPVPPVPPAGANGGAALEPLSRLQQTVARRMAQAKARVPEFALFVDVDMTECVALRQRLGKIADSTPSYNDMIVKAAALALREFPRVNGSYREDGFVLHERVNVGIAVAAQDALVVPVIADADRRSLGSITAESRRLATAVRSGTVAAADLDGGTFTVSNLGMFGVSHFAAIVNAPQAAILSVGALAPRVVATADGAVVVRQTLTLGLVCDHRILYGADGARFLSRLGELLEQPLAMAL
jgi:pyruvate dehydrogenase E2 component (dihydrolipoamide acetyltransferase)